MIPREILRKVRQIEIRTNREVTDVLGGQYHSVFKGRGMEFEEVREYLPGDEVRSIDWNVTARFGHPFVKKFKEERELTVMLVVDVSASGQFGSVRQTKNELAAELAAVLAFSAIRNNDKVGLIMFTDEIELYRAAEEGAASRAARRPRNPGVSTERTRHEPGVGARLSESRSVAPRGDVCAFGFSGYR